MPPAIPPGPFPDICAHMAYMPRSLPNFPGDLQHDLRDFLQDHRNDTIALWSGLAAQTYINAAILLGIPDDPVADCLMADDRLNPAYLSVAHDMMAAYFRRHVMPAVLDGPDTFILRGKRGAVKWSYQGLLMAFQNWLMAETADLAVTRPRVVRLICLIIVQQNSSAGRNAQIDLFEALRENYPVPQFEQAV